MNKSGFDDSSPCIGKCFLDAESLTCTGCYRTLEEITDWQEYGEKEKKKILKKALKRKMEYK